MDTANLDTSRRRFNMDLRRFRLRALFALTRAHPTLAALLATIVLMEIVHGIELLALFPLYLSDVEHESASLIALTISVYLVVDIIVRPPAGWLADRLGRRHVLLVGITLSALPLPWMMQTRDANLFLLLNALNGVGAGCIWPCIYARIADQYGKGQRGLIFGLVNTVMLGGLASGPITGNLLVGLSGSFTFSFLFCLMLVVGAFAVVASGVRETTQEQTSPPAQERREAQSRPFAERADPQIIILFLIVFCLTVGIACLVPILSLYGKEVLRLTPIQFGLTLALPAVATAVALIPFGRWADRRGAKWPLAVGLGVFAFCLWLSPISTLPLVVAVGATIGGLGYALAVPAWNALTMERIPQDARGALLGVVAALQGIGLVIGPTVGGALWEQVSHFAPFMAAAAAMTVGAALALLVKEPESVNAE